MNLGAGVMMGDDTEARYLHTSTCIDIKIAGRDMRDQSGGPILLSVKLVHQKSKLACYKGMPGSKYQPSMRLKPLGEFEQALHFAR